MSPAPRKARFNKGQWQVQRERLHLDLRSPPENNRQIRELGDLLPKVLAEAGLDGAFRLEQLDGDWVDVVGEQVAAHTRPAQIQGETLLVFVDSAAWLSEIQRYGQSQMLRNLGKHPLGKRIRLLHFRLDPEGTSRSRRHQG